MSVNDHGLALKATVTFGVKLCVAVVVTEKSKVSDVPISVGVEPGTRVYVLFELSVIEAKRLWALRITEAGSIARPAVVGAGSVRVSTPLVTVAWVAVGGGAPLGKNE